MSIKLHLQQLLQVSADAGNGVALKKAYSQALCFHFVLAYRAFLQEVAVDYQISVDFDESFSNLDLKLKNSGVVCQQCVVLADLEQEPESWLYWVLAQYQSCLVLNTQVQVRAGQVVGNLIGVKDLMAIEIEDQYQNAYQCFQEIVEQYRLLMQEW